MTVIPRRHDRCIRSAAPDARLDHAAGAEPRRLCKLWCGRVVLAYTVSEYDAVGRVVGGAKAVAELQKPMSVGRHVKRVKRQLRKELVAAHGKDGASCADQMEWIRAYLSTGRHVRLQGRHVRLPETGPGLDLSAR